MQIKSIIYKKNANNFKIYIHIIYLDEKIINEEQIIEEDNSSSDENKSNNASTT
jgi:hypothetical protein